MLNFIHIMFIIVPIFIFAVLIFMIISIFKQGKNTILRVNYDTKDDEFEKIYSKIVSSADIEKLNEQRNKAKFDMGKLKKVGLPIVLCIIGNIIFPNFIGPILALALFAYIFIFSIFNFKYKEKIQYTQNYKSTVIVELIKNMDNEIMYHPNSGMDRSIYRESKFEGFDRYESDDLITGNLKNNCKITMADIHTQIKSEDSDGDITYTDLFSGMYTIIELPKKFNDVIYIKKDKKNDGFGYSYKVQDGFSSYEKIDLDSQEFEKYFDVHGSNKIVAVQLLTSDVMQMLIEFREKMGIRYEIAIRDSKIYIRFFSGPMFETPDYNTDPLDKNTIYRYYTMLKFIFDIAYKLNEIIENTEY